jgi:Skp family chaperone for outer membrane proteins
MTTNETHRRLESLLASPAAGKLLAAVDAQDREKLAQDRTAAASTLAEIIPAHDATMASMDADLSVSADALQAARESLAECKKHHDALARERAWIRLNTEAKERTLREAVRHAADPALREFLKELAKMFDETRSEGKPDLRSTGKKIIDLISGKRRAPFIYDWTRIQARQLAIRSAKVEAEAAMEQPLSVAEVDHLVSRLRSSIPPLPR